MWFTRIPLIFINILFCSFLLLLFVSTLCNIQQPKSTQGDVSQKQIGVMRWHHCFCISCLKITQVHADPTCLLKTLRKADVVQHTKTEQTLWTVMNFPKISLSQQLRKSPKVSRGCQLLLPLHWHR